MIRLLVLLSALPLFGADNVHLVIERLITTQNQNDERAQQYTYTEETERFAFDKRGKARKTEAETHEVIFVEGIKYKKLVARNGKPLSAHEKAQVEKDMRLTAEERRKHQTPLPPGGVISFSGRFSQHSLALGSLRELLALCDNKLAGAETVRGHQAWIVESTPRRGYTPVSEHEREVLIFSKKFWVDQREGVLVRAVYTVASEDSVFRPGSTLTFEYEKVDEETWEPVSLTLNFSNSNEKVFRPTARTVYTMSEFKKFDVHSTITVVEPDAAK